MVNGLIDMNMKTNNLPIMTDKLNSLFGERLQQHVKMDHYSSARVGGYADYLLIAKSASQLEQDILKLWEHHIPFHLFGGGSNILICENGIRGLVLINQAREIQINTDAAVPTVWAESGALLSILVKQVGNAGFSGLEWATALPGTLGGAVYGNAGAFGKEISQNLIMAEILQVSFGRKRWSSKDFDYQYRSSVLKRERGQPIVILSALLELQFGDREEIYLCMETLKSKRMVKQPPGACTGSMFKNPPDDFAGRLIEAAGLKGTKIGDVEISEKHGNFFINNGSGTADDFMALIRLARKTVADKFGIHLDLEVELLGNWEN